MSTATNAPVSPCPRPGRLNAVLGMAVALLGIIAYVVQVGWFARLTVPWYLPICGVLGAGLLALSLVYCRTAWRIVGLVVFGLLAGGECYFIVAMSRLPDYQGPVKVGRPFPAFTTKRADGGPYTGKAFRGDKDTVLVFYRGWW